MADKKKTKISGGKKLKLKTIFSDLKNILSLLPIYFYFLLVLFVLSYIFFAEYDLFTEKFTIAQLTIIINFLRVIIWPAVILIIFAIIRLPIIDYLKSIINLTLKAGGVELSTSTQKALNLPISSEKSTSNNEIDKLKETNQGLQNSNQSKNKHIKALERLVTHYSNLAEVYEFDYMDKNLVSNSKRALIWMKKNISTTKDNFMLNFSLISTPNRSTDAEKAAILNALLSAALINMSSDKIYLTTKGIRYYEHIRTSLPQYFSNINPSQ